MIRLIVSILFVATTINIGAQNKKAEQIIQNAEKAYNATKGVVASFAMEIIEGKNRHTEKGTIALRSTSFYVETESLKCWYDGKRQWLLPLGSSEVNLSEPTEKEMELYNPNKLFSLYKQGYTLKYAGEKASAKGVSDIIELSTTKNKRNEIITAQINRGSAQIEKIVLQQNKMQTIITLTNYRTNQGFAIDYFTFPTAKFPNTEIIDLR